MVLSARTSSFNFEVSTLFQSWILRLMVFFTVGLEGAVDSDYVVVTKSWNGVTFFYEVGVVSEKKIQNWGATRGEVNNLT